ncbi:hypothetical protein ABIF65_006254 [Bradyrhizobium japonicum]|uniref:toll/interleukin-1 receptor domain-containing protein n=1 Tax=Bradyrhizobium TaxID=374 RepID=UPI001BABEE79|nr:MULTISPECIES: toll/interleukin-1 receptor domain-containing protein [Bradyrhizobium]MBR0881440.1 toll/interleukin-1 receptor domain-containing protein [Bradyrhizobium liaoningense]MCP1782881.1 hypothetical protein [Bradyrhizobium japonicum]MCP1964829.1 hypothetical protein [Bradyrhizobium japonicum]
MTDYDWDAFISHASEDKDDVARPLANQLAGFGLRVWLDESEIQLGNSLRVKIDAGLVHSRFGIVILSPSFFSKVWTKSELDGLVAKESDGTKVILPIWHQLSREDVQKHSPILAGRLAARTSEGIRAVASKIIKVVSGSGPTSRKGTPIFAGRLTKKKLLELPEGSFFLSNTYNADLTPALAKEIPSHHAREPYWEKLSKEGLTKSKCYIFSDASAYREHMAARDIYKPEEPGGANPRPAAKVTAAKFDIDLVRAYLAVGRSPPEA